jgi:hypothetical protein
MPAAPTLRGRLAVDQLQSTALWPHVTAFYPDGDGCRGVLSPAGRSLLRQDPRFQSGPFSLLHPDIPEPRGDYRSLKGAFGKGSMQLVVCDATGEFWCDVDRYSAYQDVVNILGHTFGEVLPHKLRRVFRWKAA